MKTLVIVTDAWHPQVNGVVTVYQQLLEELKGFDLNVVLIEPSAFRTVPAQFYPEIRLSVFPSPAMRRMLDSVQPDYVHIATEGPLGRAARRHCKRRGWRYTSAYHTRFDLYFSRYLYGTGRIAARIDRNFHADAARIMTASPSLKKTLEDDGYRNVAVWPLGVDAEQFQRRSVAPDRRLKAPVFLYFGRVAAEKDVDEFFSCDVPGARLIIGDGPERARLEKRWPDAVFVGTKKGDELVEWLSRADVLIFPSRTETFGLVILEALACGIPVAAHECVGPRDIIESGIDGVLDDDLGRAARACLSLDRTRCREKALKYSWRDSARIFYTNLVPIRDGS